MVATKAIYTLIFPLILKQYEKSDYFKCKTHIYYPFILLNPASFRGHLRTVRGKILQSKIRRETFRCDIPVVFCKLNKIYITSSRNTTKFIILCCTICNTTTCFGPFQAIFRLYTLSLRAIRIHYSLVLRVIRVHYPQGQRIQPEDDLKWSETCSCVTYCTTQCNKILLCFNCQLYILYLV